MNEHIELVRKWLADPGSVTQEELQKNSRAAWGAAAAAEAAKNAAWGAAWGAAEAARAADSAHASYAADAAYWVNEFEEINDE